MTSADTPPSTGEATAPAAGAELSIPKHRFDEVAAEVRRLREEVAMKDRLYLEDRQRFAAQQQPRPETDLTPEETGLDPQTHKAIMNVATKIAEKAINREKAVFEQQIGMLANRTEKAELLASKGSDKQKYFPAIQRKQQEHYQRTGTFLPADIALDLLESEEKDRKIRDLEARLAGKAPEPAPASDPTQNVPTGGVPSAAGTRSIPSGGAVAPPSGTKDFSQLSVEEMEARLEEQFKAGARA